MNNDPNKRKADELIDLVSNQVRSNPAIQAVIHTVILKVMQGAPKEEVYEELRSHEFFNDLERKINDMGGQNPVVYERMMKAMKQRREEGQNDG